MKQQVLTIMENVPVTGSVYRMRLEGAELEAQKPGGFVNILITDSVTGDRILEMDAGKHGGDR